MKLDDQKLNVRDGMDEFSRKEQKMFCIVCICFVCLLVIGYVLNLLLPLETKQCFMNMIACIL